MTVMLPIAVSSKEQFVNMYGLLHVKNISMKETLTVRRKMTAKNTFLLPLMFCSLLYIYCLIQGNNILAAVYGRPME